MAGTTASRDAASDWEAVRSVGDIQFAPLARVKPPANPQIPDWLRKLGEVLESIFAPIGKLLGMSWPVFEKVLIALAIVLVLFVLWRIFHPLIETWLSRPAEAPEESWAPAEAEALALLGDADRLAAEGRFAAAVHLLLKRSVGQIRDARPDWLHPATTAREISALPMLPPNGRETFATIAARVERSRFALRDLDQDDWNAAREAYARFAKVELRA
ncbi:hypothetical protein [Novosphingobium sp. ST904]|uniref:hypothetical protein n=1 Tax=Novosphingobium sp. ST904 TaxID=1684385 RepID=UPI0006CDD731|nr:hypothetical protein [Novosphingobium sp. ST904]KPH59203.1 hypothetical protein ADT71_23985 [Novosphingobium sp. ST904]TCM37706.1 hypothetical protein EDF59_110102 [Novosphingobium sp. ST904]